MAEDAPEIDSEKLPRHVAFIMDGNGRWAKQQGHPRTEGHRRGVEVVREILTCCQDWSIPYASFYAFSTENWKRPESEINLLFELMADYLEREIDSFIDDNARLHLVGDPASIPDRARETLQRALDRTAHLDGRHVLLAVNYGGRDEIVRAARRWAEDPEGPTPEALTQASFADYLDTAGMPDPDLLIRTSGEQRISNFLLWQLAYSEFVFEPRPWPEFGRESFREVLEAFGKRGRRFGKTDEQVRSS